MVTAKKVIWTENAKKDLHKIFTRIEGNVSKARAQEVIASILESTAKLSSEYPLGKPEGLLRNETDPYKFIHAAFYKVIYSIVEDNVVIEVIYHQRQDPVV